MLIREAAARHVHSAESSSLHPDDTDTAALRRMASYVGNTRQRFSTLVQGARCQGMFDAIAVMHEPSAVRQQMYARGDEGEEELDEGQGGEDTNVDTTLEEE